MRSLARVAATARYPPGRPFPSEIRTGSTPSRSQANIRPVRTHPVATASELGVEEIDAAHAHRADRVAVVCVAHRHEPVLLRPPDPPPVGERHLEPDLDRGGARVREEDLAETAWGQLDEPGCELDRRDVRE